MPSALMLHRFVGAILTKRRLLALYMCLYCTVTWVAINLLAGESSSQVDLPVQRIPQTNIYRTEPPMYALCGKAAKYLARRQHTHGTVVIVGALTALGAWLATTLKGSGMKVLAVSYVTEMTSETLIWYRRQQLFNVGIVVHVVDPDEFPALVKDHVISDMIYIPQTLDADCSVQVTSSTLLEDLTNFAYTLETVKHSVLYSVILPSRTDGSLLGSWSHTFETVLAVYHKLHSIPTVILQFFGLYGPWTCYMLNSTTSNSFDLKQHWYITDIANIIQSTLLLHSDCLLVDLNKYKNSETDHSFLQLNLTQHSFEEGMSMSAVWVRSYLSHFMHRNTEVVFTSYFTTSRDPQWNMMRPTDHFCYMMDWYLSLKQLNIRAVVFHDGLSQSFIQRIMKNYGLVEFVYISSLNSRTTNDARFYAYNMYLEQHPEISMVLLTDISDITFQKNPFHLMHLLGDNVYVGTDIDIFPSMKYMPWITNKLEACFDPQEFTLDSFRCLPYLDTVYNAGVIGGRRETMMAILWWITHYLQLSSQELNCNMPAVNIALHRHFYDKVFTGYPLVSRFMYRQSNPKGVYIVHK